MNRTFYFKYNAAAIKPNGFIDAGDDIDWDSLEWKNLKAPSGATVEFVEYSDGAFTIDVSKNGTYSVDVRIMDLDGSWSEWDTLKLKIGKRLGNLSPVVFNPQPSSFNAAQSVTLTSPDGGWIVYTTDGSEPNVNSNKYTSPISVSADTVINAVAYKGNDCLEYTSDVSTGEYLIDPLLAPNFELEITANKNDNEVSIGEELEFTVKVKRKNSLPNEHGITVSVLQYPSGFVMDQETIGSISPFAFNIPAGALTTDEASFKIHGVITAQNSPVSANLNLISPDTLYGLNPVTLNVVSSPAEVVALLSVSDEEPNVGDLITLTATTSPPQLGASYVFKKGLTVIQSGTNPVCSFQSNGDATSGSYCVLVSYNGATSQSNNVVITEQGTVSYNSAAYSAQFAKTNCPNGYSGTTVTFGVPAGQFTSNVSQQDADNLAIAYVSTNGEAYANANGSCMLALTSSSFSLSQTVSNATPQNGVPVTFYLVVAKNNGASNSGDITISDVLPSGFTAGQPTVGSFTNNVWTIPALQMTGNTASMAISGTASGTVTNTATISVSGTDITNGSTTASTQFVTQAQQINFVVQPQDVSIQEGLAGSFIMQVNDLSSAIQPQISVDGGTTWNNVGISGQPNNLGIYQFSLSISTLQMSGNLYRFVATHGMLSTISDEVSLTVTAATQSTFQLSGVYSGMNPQIVLIGETGGNVTVDWGDGSALQTVTLTAYSQQTINHTCLTTGDKPVTVNIPTGMVLRKVHFTVDGSVAASLPWIHWKSVNVSQWQNTYSQSDFLVAWSENLQSLTPFTTLSGESRPIHLSACPSTFVKSGMNLQALFSVCSSLKVDNCGFTTAEADAFIAQAYNQAFQNGIGSRTIDFVNGNSPHPNQPYTEPIPAPYNNMTQVAGFMFRWAVLNN